MAEVNCFTSLYVLLMFLCCCPTCSHGFGTFGFNIHHRYSDAVKGILAVDDLPEKGSFSYYSALVHRDRVFRGRGLAMERNQTQLTFEYGNGTYRLDSLGLYVYLFSFIYIYFQFLAVLIVIFFNTKYTSESMKNFIVAIWRVK